MGIVKVNELLQHATKNHYGVAAINVCNFETIKAVVAAAEEERVPVIIQFFPGLAVHCPVNHIAYMAKDLASKASVPIGVHLDHSRGFDIAIGGIRDGFPSVMVDGSALPFEENVQLTAEVVRIASVFGVDVEAELGHVGAGRNLEDFVNADLFTKPQQAKEFVERTGCGSLAIAVGNAHGPYIKTPNLDFERIQQIREAVDVPLVMHGGSGIPQEQMRKAIELGMSKFNIATEYFEASFEALKQLQNQPDANYIQVQMKAQQAMKEFVKQKIRMLNPNDYHV